MVVLDEGVVVGVVEVEAFDAGVAGALAVELDEEVVESLFAARESVL